MSEAAPFTAETSSEARLPAAIRFIDRLSTLASFGAAAALILLIVNVCIDVVGRTLFHAPFPGTLEYTAYWWMPALTLLAFALTEKGQEHIKVTILLDALPLRMRQLVEGSFGTLAALLVAVLAYYTLVDALQSARLGQTTPSAPPVPIWPFKFVAVAGLALLTLQALATAYRHFARRFPLGAHDLDGMPPQAAGADAPRKHRVASAVFAVGLLVAAAAVLAMAFGGLPNELIGGMVIILSIVLLLMGVPVGIAILGAAVVGLWSLSGARVVISTLKAVTYDGAASWSYSVIPMFILMGMILWKSGLTASAFETARRWLGWMPGGLAVATNFAGATLAASSGSTIGITYALGRVSIPEMLKSGYSPQLAVGSVAAAGTLGQIIPPSLLLVVYAGAASVPVGQQLLAGVVPGLILAAAFALLIIGMVVVKPSMAPRADMTGITWAMRFESLGNLFPIAVVVAIIIGGLFAGIFTATESGVFGMLAALLFGTAHQLRSGSSWRQIGVTLRESIGGTLTGTASIFLLIIGVVVLTRAMALSQVPNTLATLIVDMGLGRVELLMILIVVYLVLGMFMDTLAMMLLTIPVLLAPLKAVGVDPLWFGVFIVVMAEVGLLTPPLGILSFIVHRIVSDPATNLGRRISLAMVFMGVAPFAIMSIVVLLLLIAFPGIVTWLPGASASQ
ncbi:MAG: TRAP transporter large permease subunit [Mesorhizobium sp.]|nr:TRAP transporter large permease subunit [Mesorhizobium sp.]